MRFVLESILSLLDRVSGLFRWTVMYTILSPSEKKELQDKVNNYFYGD